MQDPPANIEGTRGASPMDGSERWYKGLSRQRNIPERCPHAYCNKCRRYLESWIEIITKHPDYADRGPDKKELTIALEAMKQHAQDATGKRSRPNIREHGGNEEWANFCPEALYECHLRYCSNYTLFFVDDCREEDENCGPLRIDAFVGGCTPLHYSMCPSYGLYELPNAIEASPLPPAKPLHKTAQGIADYIREHPGALGKNIAEGTGNKEQNVRRLISTKLVPLGFHNERGQGYFPPDGM